MRAPARTGLCLLAVLAACAAGCRRHLWYEWRDEPYIRPVFLAGEGAALARMASAWTDDREIGCRALGALAREAHERGDMATAARLAQKLMEHFDAETDPTTRSMILAVCLREAGEGVPEVPAFLVSRLACGEHPVAAACGLAALRPPGAFAAIAGALPRSADFETRLGLLEALWLLGDARAVPIFERTLAEFDAAWPARIGRQSREECRRALAGRLETLRATCAAGPDMRSERQE